MRVPRTLRRPHPHATTTRTCRRRTSTGCRTGGTPRASTAARTSSATGCARSPTASSSLQDGRLPLDHQTGTAITGFSENWWVGLGMLHTLFTLEHNAICDDAEEEAPGDERRRALRHRPAGQLRPDREDPHGRVDAGDHRPPGAPDRHARQLVGAAGRAPAPPRRPRRQQRGAQRHPGLARRPARGAVPADRGVRLGLPPAPAAARRARAALAGRRHADRLDGLRRDHPAERREGTREWREVGRPLLLVRHPAPGRGLRCTTTRAGCRT